MWSFSPWHYKIVELFSCKCLLLGLSGIQSTGAGLDWISVGILTAIAILRRILDFKYCSKARAVRRAPCRASHRPALSLYRRGSAIMKSRLVLAERSASLPHSSSVQLMFIKSGWRRCLSRSYPCQNKSMQWSCSLVVCSFARRLLKFWTALFSPTILSYQSTQTT